MKLSKWNSLIGIAGILATSAVLAAPAAELPEAATVHAVMFEIEYDLAGAIRHAQAIGGYPTLDACVAAMPRVMAFITSQVESGLTGQVHCTGQLMPPSPNVEQKRKDTVL